MDLDTASDNTSLDDKTEDFCDNPTRDALTEGLMSMLKPTVDQLEKRIRATRISQIEMMKQLDSMNEELSKASASLYHPLASDSYVQKLVKAKQKVTIVSNILQTSHDRLNRIHLAIRKESAQKEASLDPSLSHSEDTDQKTPKDEEDGKSSAEDLK